MFWEKYSELCEKNKFSPIETAKAIGISDVTCTELENGAMPTSDILLLVADRFDCSVDYLLDRTEYYQSHKPIAITTGDIKDNINCVIGNDNGEVLINATTTGQAAALLKAFEKLDPFKQAKVLVYVEELKNSTYNT